MIVPPNQTKFIIFSIIIHKLFFTLKLTKKITFVLLLSLQTVNLVFSQTMRRNGFYSPLNRLKFGNQLFVQKDYLRAIDEYNAYLSIFKNDTIKFKIAFAYSEMGKFSISLSKFRALFGSKSLGNYSKLYYARENFKNKNFNYFLHEARNSVMPFANDSSFSFKNNIRMMQRFSELFGDNIYQNASIFLSPFPKNIRNDVRSFYERKIKPNYKSEITAGVLSAIIPGSGKVYADKTGDGITAFLVTGLLTFLAVDNFNANHKTRAWIFTGLASAFYAGNIYGSLIAVRQYNLGIQISFGKEVNLFLKRHNYFAPIPKFLFH